MDLTFSDCHNGLDVFEWSHILTDTHDAVQSVAGNATWFNEFIPFVEGCRKRFAEVLLLLCHILGLVLCSCGSVCHLHRWQTRVTTISANYIHGIPHSKLSPEILLLAVTFVYFKGVLLVWVVAIDSTGG